MKYRLRATRDQRYNTRMLRAGDEFETDSNAVRKIYLSKGGVEQVLPGEKKPKHDGPTASDLRRMRKADLADFLTQNGEEVEDDETREDLLDRALQLV